MIYKLIELSGRGSNHRLEVDGNVKFSSISEKNGLLHCIQNMTNSDTYHLVSASGKVERPYTKQQLIDEVRNANKYLAEHDYPPYLKL